MPTSDRPQTLTCRPISFAEIEKMSRSSEPNRFYYLDAEADGLVPVTVRTSPASQQGSRRNGTTEPGAYYAAVPVDGNTGAGYKLDMAAGPVGYRHRAEVHSAFGSVTTGDLFTSEEAEASALLVEGHHEPTRLRTRLYAPDPDGTEMVLVPVYGSQVTLSAIVANLDPDELETRIRRALNTEFGDDLRPVMKVKTRPVADTRVDLYRDGHPVAIHVLSAEKPAFMDGPGGPLVSTASRGNETVHVG
jgi:hypothetical protein